jgi:hypothetical protein
MIPTLSERNKRYNDATIFALVFCKAAMKRERIKKRSGYGEVQMADEGMGGDYYCTSLFPLFHTSLHSFITLTATAVATA